MFVVNCRAEAMVGDVKCELVLALVLFKCLHYVKTVLLDEALKTVQGDPSTEQNQKKKCLPCPIINSSGIEC